MVQELGPARSPMHKPMLDFSLDSASALRLSRSVTFRSHSSLPKWLLVYALERCQPELSDTRKGWIGRVCFDISVKLLSRRTKLLDRRMITLNHFKPDVGDPLGHYSSNKENLFVWSLIENFLGGLKVTIAASPSKPEDVITMSSFIGGRNAS